MNLKEIIFASTNKGKIKEVSAIFSQLNIKIIPQSNFNIPEAEEIGLSFIENAIIKARHCAKYTGLPALADDSGLEVSYLNGEPGIYSARYAGKNSNSDSNLDKLLLKLKNTPIKDRAARFICTIALVKHTKDPTPIIAEGIWNGLILEQRAGTNGFGYDPVFYVPEYKKTAAELGPELKNKISHRAIALERLKEKLI
jgi:XTP/dITP diphosphohydrolase